MQLVEDHFGEHIYSLVQEDLSDEDTKRGAADADAVNMDDICASVHERAILLSVIDNWKSGKSKDGRRGRLLLGPQGTDLCCCAQSPCPRDSCPEVLGKCHLWAAR